MRRLLLAALAVVTFALPGQGESDPDTDRGMRPGLPYRVEGLDQVNIFNGNLTLNVPLGQQFNVNGTLSYQFLASYATNPWETGEHELTWPESPDNFTYYYKYPARNQNGGLGWVVTLGQLFRDDNGKLHYMSPDGGEHRFHSTLHNGETSVSGISYTRDGTYLRYRLLGGGVGQVEFPNGNIHIFDSLGRLMRMQDPYGNWVKVHYT
ncbi:MAG TPA: hypothetical protein VEU30_01505, partial [Thermoanaerobaculia bacterium]|nr:hypothetical protein [Thermoanaerobaculia bacterium]